MIHEIFPVGPLQCNCSVIGDEQSREAMIIDPGDEIERVLDSVRKHGLKVTLIVVTHAHIDHIGGAAKLKAATGAPVVMNQNDSALLEMLGVAEDWIGMLAQGGVRVDWREGSGRRVGAGSEEA